jgi:negative regulator of flagellin synthesis FlgM
MIDRVPTGPVSRTSSTRLASPSPHRVANEVPTRDAAGASASLPRLVTLAADLARQGPPVDYARIAQIRQAIAEGSYTVDPVAIASSMIAFHSDSGT